MANRRKLRRKMVLPVVVVRDNSEEKHLAHTLDVTEISARLGGLKVLLEPGEIIEIQRGGRKAKFQVYWTGASGTELEGQAGVRGVGTGRSIWSIHLPPDESDLTIIDAIYLRQETPPTRVAKGALSSPCAPVRYACNAGASLRAPGSNYPFRVQVKSLHLDGMEVESITTLPLNTLVNLEMRIEGILLETAGRVTGSTHRVGMEIGFHKVTPEFQRKIVQALQKLKQKAWDEQQVPARPQSVSPAVLAIAEPPPPPLRMDPLRELLALCRMLRNDFDRRKSTLTEAEIQELRRALAEFQAMLSPAITLDIAEYLAMNVPESSGQA